ncbi:MAG: hypothetical protein L0Y57_12095, partial [Beijerinckiaceae bacterium]|nr:hypothetical protein [Beijerinckiaceae bacterium]
MYQAGQFGLAFGAGKFDDAARNSNSCNIEAASLIWDAVWRGKAKAAKRGVLAGKLDCRDSCKSMTPEAFCMHYPGMLAVARDMDLGVQHSSPGQSSRMGPRLS